ncbi:MAG: N-acetylglutaminylglutamine amidotransferase, partial [Proteobacteria bacterium]|nr:N-acetylglutaminylglutamine amidotransferase [Pseudomonadota bacterium]
MCGLCGELRFDATAPDRAVIERMKDKLQKRGPDSEGTFVNAPIALGHRRLAIIDLTDKAAQPMIDEPADVALVFNGTIYNYPDLRKQLQTLGHSF